MIGLRNASPPSCVLLTAQNNSQRFWRDYGPHRSASHHPANKNPQLIIFFEEVSSPAQITRPSSPTVASKVRELVKTSALQSRQSKSKQASPAESSEFPGPEYCPIVTRISEMEHCARSPKAP